MFGSQDPGRKSKTAVWSVVKVKPNGMLCGWIAGNMIGVYTHYLKASKPCYTAMTDDQLECPYCATRGLPEWKGYLPMYDETGKPVVLLVHQNLKPQVDALGLHEPVIVRRGEGKFDTVSVKRDKAGQLYRPGNSDRQRAADIRHWLLVTLWKEEPLIDWFQQHGQTPPLPEMTVLTPAERKQPAQVMDDQGKIEPAVLEDIRAKVKVAMKGGPVAVGEVVPDAIRHLNGHARDARPSVNGSAHKREG